jgi:uncharacterized protein (TIGR02996 family)
VPADHPEYLALLRVVCAAPDDDTPRLVAADWLQDHGNPDRAEFIRVQVELARLEAAGSGATPEAEALRKKEWAYLGPRSDLRPLWAMDDGPGLVRVRFRGNTPLAGLAVDGADRLVYRRGFVEKVVCPAAEWRHHAATIRERQPIREVLLTGCDRMTRDHWYAALPALRGLARVVLDAADPGHDRWLGQFLPGTAVVQQNAR